MNSVDLKTGELIHPKYLKKKLELDFNSVFNKNHITNRKVEF